MPAFSDKVSDYPVLFPELQIFHANACRFGAAKSAAEKYGKDRAIAFPAESVRARSSQRCFPLFHSQPVANPDTQSFCTFDSGDAGGEFRAQQPCVGSFIGETADCCQANVDG